MFTCQHLVRFDDVDGAGIVYYPRYFHFCHKTFEDLFNQHGPITYPVLINEQKIGFPTVHIESDYKKPFFYGDTIDAHFCVKSIGNSSIITEYNFFNRGQKSFTAKITVVCMDLMAKKSVQISDPLRVFFAHYIDT